MALTRRRLIRNGLGAGAGLAIGARGGLPVLADAAARPRSPAYALGFRSLTDEVRLASIPVEGRVPHWLEGVLLRNGPALFEIGEQKLNHWFDGLAMLHGFSFSSGRVSYANRFLHSSAYRAWKHDGVMRYSEFGTDPDPDPCRAIFNGVSTLPVLGRVPNANVSIERLGHTFMTHTELPLPVRFDARTLRTLGVGDGELPQGRLGTAHPHHDPRSGERFSYEIELLPPSGFRVLVQRHGAPRELAFIPQPRPGYMHSFGLTDNYVVVHTQPWEFDLGRFLSADRGPIATNFSWNAAEPSRVILVDRNRGGVAATVELEPNFVFHHINAFEQGNRVVVDVCAHRDSSAVEALYLTRLRDSGSRVPHGAARRLTIRPMSSSVTQRDLAAGDIELPRIDYDTVNGRPYRYIYGVGTRTPRSGFIDRIVKVDIRREEMTGWQEPGAYPGEPVFVRRPGGRREDDGVLLSVVLDASRRTSYLLVLDARDLSEIGRASVPHHIPFGFHGIHAVPK